MNRLFSVRRLIAIRPISRIAAVLALMTAIANLTGCASAHKRDIIYVPAETNLSPVPIVQDPPTYSAFPAWGQTGSSTNHNHHKHSLFGKPWLKTKATVGGHSSRAHHGFWNWFYD